MLTFPLDNGEKADIIRLNGCSTTKRGERLMSSKGVARRTAQRELAALAQQGTLQAKGNGRARKYFLP